MLLPPGVSPSGWCLQLLSGACSCHTFPHSVSTPSLRYVPAERVQTAPFAASHRPSCAAVVVLSTAAVRHTHRWLPPSLFVNPSTQHRPRSTPTQGRLHSEMCAHDKVFSADVLVSHQVLL
mmetsp:Transcript_2246/g.4161  ORF Transcript_2246/g.4161 Transcript_2246/m.4161 type:complete len:121 (-) Transcript_2246:122-484(-)